MKHQITKLIAFLFGNQIGQSLLQKNVDWSHYFMGIGAGSDVTSSGESVLVQKLRQRYRERDARLCVFDVGANKGQFLRLMQTGLPGIPVIFHVFEPAKVAFQVLQKNIQNLPHIYLNNIGLGKTSGQAELYYNKPGSGLASLSKRRLEHLDIHFDLVETIQMTTLDEYCAQHAVKQIDLLKLDVEGYEFAVLQGGAETFRAGKVWALTFEFGGSNIDSRTYFQDFWYLLHDYGMKSFFRITPSGYLSPIREYCEIHEQFRTTNYLILRESQ